MTRNSVASSNLASVGYDSELPHSQVTRLTSKSKLRIIYTWEGCVEEIYDDTFLVTLKSERDGNEPASEVCTFKLSELTTKEQNQLEIGSIIEWKIGKLKMKNGKTKNVSKIKLCQFPSYSSKDYKRSLKKAEKTLKGINLDATTPKR